MTTPVYVQGVGALTPLGLDWPSSFTRLAAGETAVRRVTEFDVAHFSSQVAAPAIERFADEEDRRLAFARRAADEALSTSSLGDRPDRIGVFIGAESGRSSLATIHQLSKIGGGGRRFDHALFGQDAVPFAERMDAAVLSPAAVTSALALQIGAEGPAATISLACASGSAAIAEGARAIRAGRCDVALCGGVGADVDPLMLVGFGRLRALSARGVSCPFDLHRDGFVVGEGAAMVVLSRTPGEIPVTIDGWGRTLDAMHLTAPDPDGGGAERAMRAALAMAGAPAIQYVQAHGTSTPLNDVIEARALNRVLGPRAAGAWVSAVKGAVGHWVAGAGAIGFLCGLEAVRRGVVLPTAGLETPDPECELELVQGAARERPVDAALVNAFAFGGANCALVLRRAR